MLTLVLAVLVAPVGAQLHSKCWLQSTGQLNAGANPSGADLLHEMQALAVEQSAPYEVLAAIAFAESSLQHFASDGYLIHNKTECSKLYDGLSAPNPPGLGLMQLTGSTAQAFDIAKLRTDWRYNLASGVQVLLGKHAIAQYYAPGWLASLLDGSRDVIESWYDPVWFYNGWVPNEGAYADKVFSHLSNQPGSLASFLPPGLAPLTPEAVIPHFLDDPMGEIFAAEESGLWSCEHGLTYSAPVTLTSLHGLDGYGTGTPGCAGGQVLSADSSPVLGNAGFHLQCNSAPAATTGWVLLGQWPDFAGSDSMGLGVKVHVALQGALYLFPIQSSSTGYASLSLPVPSAPAFAGSTWYAQAAWPWPASCPLPPAGLSTSAGLVIEIQGPGSEPTELVQNGSFGVGGAAWSSAGDFWAGTQFGNYKSPPGYAAGGVDTGGVAIDHADGQLWQNVALPATAQQLTLRFWVNVTSNETTSTVPYDTLVVTVRDASGGAVLATVAALSNLDAGPLAAYSAYQLDLTPLAGSTVRLHFDADTDVGLTTTFRVDDVSVLAQ